jgi:GGDEF domain-containing protein
MTPHDPLLETSAAPLLPAREAVLARLGEQLRSASETEPRTGTLLIVGLLRRDDGWPLSERTRTAVTSMLARSLRGEDWFGSSGPTEFAVLTDAPPVAAGPMAERLVAGIARLGIAGLCGAAGTVPLAGDADAAELLRRATLSLTTARQTGPGTVVHYREPVAAPLSW